MDVEIVRMSLSVEPDIPEKLAELAGGKRKMSEFVTILVRELYENGGKLKQELPKFDSHSTEVEIYMAATRDLWNKVAELERHVAELKKRG